VNAAPNILAFRRITRRFPGVTALSDVSFDVRAGECHALIGENGAGKSTLGKIVAGIYQPDDGQMMLDGQPVRFRTPAAAMRAGIAIVHQELAFCPNLSVAENLWLGRMPARCGCVARRIMRDGARRMLDAVGLSLDPDTPMERLSTAQEQLVQVAAAVGRDARIIVMDEPTSSLSAGEAGRLFEILAQLRERRVTILYVSHRLEEIRRLCDRVTVLRDGRVIRTLRTADTTTDEIVRLMIGRSVAEYFPSHLQALLGPPLLSVERLTRAGRFHEVSFEVRAGEVVGLAGLVGAGRSEVARAIFGIDRLDRGTIRLEGRPVRIDSPQSAIRQGIGLLPEDRKRQGLVLTMSCKENLSLAVLRRLARWVFLRHHAEERLVHDYFVRLGVRATGIDATVAGLSGGNQQKVALAKWLARNCRVLILDEPTRGVDVGAKAEIHALIDRLAADGKAVLLISSELPEVLNLSRRVIVMADGRVTGELPRERATPENVMRLMANVRAA
jgi:ABC-type sugar transport system ATPase subunit